MSASVKLAVIRLCLAASILAAWEYASRVRHLEFYLSKPTDIASRLMVWISDGTLMTNLQATVFVAVIGFVIGSCAGLMIGLLLGRATVVAKVLDPFLMAFYSMPKVALGPVFVLWFGIDTSMKIIFVAVVVFFLVFLNTYSGVRNVSRDQITILRLMGANEMDLMRKVVLPSAFSVPYALIGTILGEMMATNKGLGFLLANTAGMFDTAGTFATLVVIVALSMIFNALVRVAEIYLTPWQSRLEAQEVSI
ncbi:ABC transporter permease [Tannerella sp. oral taxon 808]|nr:ABC transporter permease [Tannerella sp. oral taxon 808]